MHVLFLTQYFPPEVGATQTRIHEFARACVAAGHRVTVITEFPNHPHGVIPPEYGGRVTTRETMDGFEVLRVWVYTRAVKSFWTRAGFYLSFCLLASVRGLMVRGPIDVVFATSPPPPVGLAGWIVARLRGARFVLDIRDLWPAGPQAVGELRNPTMIRLIDALANFLYRHADRITAVTRGFVRHIAEKVGPARVELLPNGAAIGVFDPSRVDPGLRARLGVEGAFLVTFAGLHGFSQGLECVLEAATLLRDHPDVVLLLIGEGPLKADLQARAETERLANVRFLPAVPLEEITPYLTASDVLLVTLLRTPVFHTFIPSKLFDFLACARPVILLVDGEAREVLEASGGGVFAEPGDGAGLRDAILQLQACPPEERARMGARGRAYVLEHYTREVQSRRLVELLQTEARSR